MKTQLKKVTHNTHLTLEEMNTLLIQIEGVLNSRPLTAISSDPLDLEALTPRHFLIGRPLIAIPEPSLLEIPENRVSRWQNIQRIKQSFWRRWHNEYLSQLQVRNKWLKQHTNIEIGVLVIIKEDNSPPLQWRLGRVINIYPGMDKLVRVVEIKTSTGIIKRSINKIAVLPIDNP